MTETVPTTYLYGASDDLIELSGHLCEEWNLYELPAYVGFSDGTLVRLSLDGDEVWNLRVMEGFAEIVPARGDDAGNDEHGCPGYSDKAIIRGDVKWAVCSNLDPVRK